MTASQPVAQQGCLSSFPVRRCVVTAVALALLGSSAFLAYLGVIAPTAPAKTVSFTASLLALAGSVVVTYLFWEQICPSKKEEEVPSSFIPAEHSTPRRGSRPRYGSDSIPSSKETVTGRRRHHSDSTSKPNFNMPRSLEDAKKHLESLQLSQGDERRKDLELLKLVEEGKGTDQMSAIEIGILAKYLSGPRRNEEIFCKRLAAELRMNPDKISPYLDECFAKPLREEARRAIFVSSRPIPLDWHIAILKHKGEEFAEYILDPRDDRWKYDHAIDRIYEAMSEEEQKSARLAAQNIYEKHPDVLNKVERFYTYYRKEIPAMLNPPTPVPPMMHQSGK